MTTLNEIRVSRRANRSFWNESVRFHIALVRAERQQPMGASTHLNQLTQWLRQNLELRAAFEFLD